MLKLFFLAVIVADVLSVVLATECGDHEEYSNCTNSGCFPQKCSENGYPVPCVDLDPEACIGGYVCKSGYLRADNGKCIPVDECPSCGGDENAESGCGTFCRRCSNYNKGPIACPASCIINGCECRPGFIYDQNIKKCVLPEQCTPTCKEHEVYESCNKSCVCEKGYKRAKNGKCVPEKKCPPACKAHEVFSTCINGGCVARNCSQLGKPVPCVKLSPDACIEGCVCEPDYYRDDKGVCVPVKECPSCGGDPNAESGCGVFCTRCSNYNSGPVACPAICQLNGCECRPGYIYDQNIKKCVLPKDCTPTCKAHEVFSNCINGGCDARNCSQLGKPVPCVDIIEGGCIKGCVCEPGYLRNDKGVCIPDKQCPSCGGDPNAQSGCGVFCTRCSNYNSGPVACPAICQLNGCECRPGYIYDQNIKKCVLPKDCTPICKAHEVYSSCTNGGCDARNCSQLGKPVPCVDIIKGGCIKGCVCEPGYLRNDKGVCIPDKQCPSCGGDPNAQAGCGVFCDRCSGKIPCPKICLPNSCDCKPGYKYDQNIKKCVLPDKCTTTCEPHEVFNDCINDGCQPRNCSQLNNPFKSKPIDKEACIKGCVCEKDYLRADNGICIPKDECPKCQAGEVYSNCKNAVCRLQDCSQYGQPIPFCPAVIPDKCYPGCVCKNKYLRNKKGVCVPEDECPEAQIPSPICEGED